jgi:hypothetical protein
MVLRLKLDNVPKVMHLTRPAFLSVLRAGNRFLSNGGRCPNSGLSVLERTVLSRFE